jgi:2-methylcitrate dehydratase PrpD
MLAQYSTPFCVALALHREARDPESYDETALGDSQIRALCRRVRLVRKRSRTPTLRRAAAMG